jgi:hypothetical protein
MSHPAQVWLRFARSAPGRLGVPARLLPLAARIGFVLHNRPPDTGRPPRNWLCLYHRPPAPARPLSEIGFVLHVCPSSPKPRPTRPRREIGFVLPKSFPCSIHHNYSPLKDLPFTLLRRKLGLFCILGLPGARLSARPGQIGCVLHNSPFVPEVLSRSSPPGIGFVSHDSLRPIGFVGTTGPRAPRRHAAGGVLPRVCPESAIRNRDTASVPRLGQLGSFCIFRPPGPWPRPVAPSPNVPSCPSLALFCTFCPSSHAPAAPSHPA